MPTGDIGVAKPDPAYFQAILARLGIPAHDVLLVDDQVRNIDAAREAGLHASLFAAEPGSGALCSTLGKFGIKGV